ncbi:hypothetical protein TIFTF001_013725 [Ficus carica]|uniref:KIB1-4 beta-propeller domain-containing protein n=1 Tax=Ficus carica TaxID=3494 RepID=A0AA88A3Z9_FICCA|nr:hypothetical protein TIFTF001_013725 [Ficus carica]
MLFVPSEEHFRHRIYNVLTNTFSDSKLVVPFKLRFCGSSLGWLVAVQSDFVVTLYKPFSMVEGGGDVDTNATIHLPPLFPPDHAESYEYYVFKAIITADPITNPDQCVIVVIFSEFCKMAYFRLTKDVTWTGIEHVGWPIDEVLYCYDQFYALNCQGDLVSFRIGEQYIRDVKVVARKPAITIVGKSYLVKSCGETFLNVIRFMEWSFVSDMNDNISEEDDMVLERATPEVVVYELDFEKGEWIEIESIGDLALFLGDNSSLCVAASDFPGCKPNCIYFTHDEDSLRSGHLRPSDFGIFHLDSQMMEYNLGIDETNLEGMFRLPIWIVPTLNE